MKIKTGDSVKILSGKDRNKTGKVTQVLFHDRKQVWYVVVEGINIMKKHMRTHEGGKTGQVLSISAPIAMSKVMLLDNDGKPTRVGYSVVGDKKVRVSKKTKQTLS